MNSVIFSLHVIPNLYLCVTESRPLFCHTMKVNGDRGCRAVKWSKKAQKAIKQVVHMTYSTLF